MRTSCMIILFFLIVACDDSNEENLQCQDCSLANFTDSLLLERFQIFKNLDEILAVSLKEPYETYQICNEAVLSEIENTKIIEVVGKLFSPCNDSFKYNFMEISKFSVIETCPRPVDTLFERKELLGTWYFINIIQSGDTLIPPCEAGETFIKLYQEEDRYFLEAFTGENSCINEIFVEKNEISVLTDATCTLSFAPTAAIRSFESSFGRFIYCDVYPCSLEYIIQNNFLTLKNLQTNYTVNLYTK